GRYTQRRQSLRRRFEEGNGRAPRQLFPACCISRKASTPYAQSPHLSSNPLVRFFGHDAVWDGLSQTWRSDRCQVCSVLCVDGSAFFCSRPTCTCLDRLVVLEAAIQH